ncbi:hypothetical protein CL614_01195 [archaeon]|nr:hypothetical protein [archaeon]|tara:strand:+ start:539 stop:1159 length:621 start_codon:yes stop_codon:yes gene_type:complete
MKKIHKNVLDFSELWTKVGAISGMIGFIVFILFTGTAISMVPGYDIINQFFSDLGSGGIAAPIYNSGLMIAGIFFAIFFLGLHVYLKKYLAMEKKDPLFVKVAIFLGILSAISLIGVGILPSSYSYLAHMTPTVAFFGLAGLSIIMLSIYLYSHDKPMAFLGLVIFFVDIAFALYINPVIQKLAVFLISLWFFVMGVRMYFFSKNS